MNLQRSPSESMNKRRRRGGSYRDVFQRPTGFTRNDIPDTVFNTIPSSEYRIRQRTQVLSREYRNVNSVLRTNSINSSSDNLVHVHDGINEER